MVRKQKDPLTPAEWKVMRLVWQLGECAARDVYERAGELYGWTPSTVKTHLRNLVEKEFLEARRVGNSFLYKPRRTPLGALQRAADKLLEKTLEGTTAPLLAYMLKKSKLTDAELEDLRQLLQTYREDES